MNTNPMNNGAPGVQANQPAYKPPIPQPSLSSAQAQRNQIASHQTDGINGQRQMQSLYAKLCVVMAILIFASLMVRVSVWPKFQAVLNQTALNTYKLELIEKASSSVNVDKKLLADTIALLPNTILTNDDSLTTKITNFLKTGVFNPNHVQYPNNVSLSQTNDELSSQITFVAPFDGGWGIIQELEKRLWVKNWGFAPVTIADQSTWAPIGGQDLYTFDVSLNISLKTK